MTPSTVYIDMLALVSRVLTAFDCCGSRAALIDGDRILERRGHGTRENFFLSNHRRRQLVHSKGLEAADV